MTGYALLLAIIKDDDEIGGIYLWALRILRDISMKLHFNK
jgi:hypothetical protein